MKMNKTIIVLLSIMGLTTVHGTSSDCTVSRKCGECVNRDCDKDSECMAGLLCADAHKPELTALGYDPRKVYCGNIGRWNWELCYDPKKLGCQSDTDCADDGNVCNGNETCNVTSGACVSGPALDCDDKNACTTDACDPITGCSNTAVVCPEGEACDRVTGACVAIDDVRPCIAVIDESDNYSDADIDQFWQQFRTAYPLRPFCLLQPLNPSYSGLHLPVTPDFSSDPRVVFAIVNRDNGDPALASDWFTACGYDTLVNIDFIGLFVDNSGSMTIGTVQASLDLLDTTLTTAGLTYCSVYDGSENWITPFTTSLGTVGGGGACN